MKLHFVLGEEVWMSSATRLAKRSQLGSVEQLSYRSTLNGLATDIDRGSPPVGRLAAARVIERCLPEMRWLMFFIVQ